MHFRRVLDGYRTAQDWHSSALIASDFTHDEQRDFTIRKQILWESETATDSEVRQVEIRYIRELRSNDPAIGYNRSPLFRG